MRKSLAFSSVLALLALTGCAQNGQPLSLNGTISQIENSADQAFTPGVYAAEENNSPRGITGLYSNAVAGGPAASIYRAMVKEAGSASTAPWMAREAAARVELSYSSPGPQTWPSATIIPLDAPAIHTELSSYQPKFPDSCRLVLLVTHMPGAVGATKFVKLSVSLCSTPGGFSVRKIRGVGGNVLVDNSDTVDYLIYKQFPQYRPAPHPVYRAPIVVARARAAHKAKVKAVAAALKAVKTPKLVNKPIPAPAPAAAPATTNDLPANLNPAPAASAPAAGAGSTSSTPAPAVTPAPAPPSGPHLAL